MQKILVAVDGSKCGERAFEAAAKLTKDLGSKLIVMTVLDDPPSLDYEGRPVYENGAAMEAKAENLVAEYAAQAKAKFGLDVNTSVWHGYPSKTIVEVAEQEGAEMIAVGTRGLGGLKELVLGSVSHDVAKRSKIPVLIVK